MSEGQLDRAHGVTLIGCLRGRADEFQVTERDVTHQPAVGSSRCDILDVVVYLINGNPRAPRVTSTGSQVSATVVPRTLRRLGRPKNSIASPRGS
jgi:hypothetical protein